MNRHRRHRKSSSEGERCVQIGHAVDRAVNGVLCWAGEYTDLEFVEI